MINKKHYTNRKQSEYLKKIGFPQDKCEHYWSDRLGKGILFSDCQFYGYDDDDIVLVFTPEENDIAAPSTQEIADWIEKIHAEHSWDNEWGYFEYTKVKNWFDLTEELAEEGLIENEN